MHKRVSFINIFGVSAVVTAILVALIGAKLGFDALFTMIALTMLEITFSLDNAVVNATVVRHHYTFELFALDSLLDLLPATPADDLLKEIQKDLITKTQIIGVVDA